MIYRFKVQHIHKRKNKITKVTAKDAKQAMRCVIHKTHGKIPEVIVWRTMWAYDNVIETGDYEVDGEKYSVCIARISVDGDPKMQENEYGQSGWRKEINL